MGLQGFPDLLQAMGGLPQPEPQPLPVPSMAPQAPSGWQRSLGLIAPAMTLGLALSGNKAAATGAAQGLAQGQVRDQNLRMQEQSMRLREQEAIERQMIRDEAVRQRQEAQERLRQQTVGNALEDVRSRVTRGEFKTKGEYDNYVAFVEQSLSMMGVRPNAIRSAVPYNGPNVKDAAAAAVNGLIKAHGAEILTSGGVIEIDRDGDGVPERVPIAEAAKLGEVPILLDPQGKPMLAPKDVKPQNVEEFDVTYRGVLAEWKADGKNVEDPAIHGRAATEARKRINASAKTGTTSIVVPPAPERPLTRYQRFTTERQLRLDADKAAAPVREIYRQVQTMRAGLTQAEGGRRTAGVQAVINSFNRILEPGSVTREAEYLRTAAGQPLLDALRGKLEAIQQGGQGVTMETLRDAVTLAEQIAQNMATYADETFSMIGEQAAEYQIPRERVIPNLSLPKRGQPPAAAQGAQRERAREILKQGGYDASDASVDKFLANPKNKALLGGG